MKTMVTFLATMALAVTVAHADGLRILYLSKSSGFQHSVVATQKGQPSHSDKVLTEVARRMGATITCTKDAGLVNAENLKNYDLVIFYTTGDLTRPGNQDQGTVMAGDGVSDLLTWLKQGGGFMGFHAATDTFHETRPGQPTPYIRMIGAEFRTHGAAFEGILDVVDTAHPAMAHFKDGWKIRDEWYLFKNMNRENMHVLALLNPGDHGSVDTKYDIPAYPIVWCMSYGKGRVYFNGMGHFEDVWSNGDFQQVVADAITWTTGKGQLDAAPNYDTTVPGDKPMAGAAGASSTK